MLQPDQCRRGRLTTVIPSIQWDSEEIEGATYYIIKLTK